MEPEPETVLITGGASGIGAAFSRHFLDRGARILIADRSEKALTAFRQQQAARTDRIEHRVLDVRDADAVKAWIDDAVARHGRIDWLFNVAGTGVGGEALNHTIDDWRYVVEVNLMGVIHGVHAAYPHMVRQKGGNIVNVASMAGLMPAPLTASYCAAKHGVVGLSRAVRVEARQYGVNVMVVCPGVVDTPLLDLGEFGRLTGDLQPGATRAAFERLRPMNPDRFAEQVLADARKNRAIIVVPRWWKLIWWLNRLCIPLADFVAAKGFLELKRHGEENRIR